MLSSRSFQLTLIAGIVGLISISCSKPQEESLGIVMPATSSVEITLDEKQVPSTCKVFSQLIISVPGGVSASDLKGSIENYGMSHGADFILIGMIRESNDTPETIVFQTYGPKSPYSFKKRWRGWTFGLADWNNGGPLLDYGHNRMEGSEAAFDLPVEGQALLLSCAPGK